MRNRTTIRKLREETDQTREQLAVAAGLASGTVKLAEQGGVHRLQVRSLMAIAEGLGLELEIKLGGRSLVI